MDPATLTRLLDEAYAGDRSAFGKIAENVYAEFHILASNAIAQKGVRADLGPTMLIDDTLMELMRQREAIGNREQFFALATRFMLRIIAHRERDARAKIRGGGVQPMELHSNDAAATQGSIGGESRFDSLRSAMEELLNAHPDAAEVVTLHIMGDLPLTKVAELTGLPLRTVERRWQLAKAFLSARSKNQA